MRYDGERLLTLLPEIQRLRDAEQGGPLAALLDVLAEQADLVDTDIARLYDDWFIETCAEWVVPYLGDLLGVRGLNRVEGGAYSRRAWVANTLGYRRRKGTLSMLRQLAQDATGLPAAATEYLPRVAWTQHLNHVRHDAVRTRDLRRSAELELAGGAFDPHGRLADVRSIARGRGRHNVPNVGLFLWRLRPFPIARVAARRAVTAADGRFRFHPVGIDAPLFNPGRPLSVATGAAQEADMPGPLRRRAVFDELEAIRRAILLGEPADPRYAEDPGIPGPEPAFRIQVRGEPEPIPGREIFVANLETWGNVPTSRAYRQADGITVNQAIRVAIDPLRGRLKFSGGEAPAAVDVDYAYGFSSPIGGGPYERGAALARRLPDRVTWRRVVRRAGPDSAEEPDVVTTLAQAIADWNAQGAGQDGVIAIADNATYRADLAIDIPAGSHLLIVGARWPATPVPGTPAVLEHVPARLAPSGIRPHVDGRIEVTGTAADDSPEPGVLALCGLLVEGSLAVLPGHLGRLVVEDTTIAPVPVSGTPPAVLPGSVAVRANPSTRTNRALRLELVRAITGPLGVAAPAAAVELADSIVDGALEARRTPVTIERCTILGPADVREVEASDTIFLEPLRAERTQAGCVRYSFVPAGSRTPRAFRCQPDQAVRDRPDEPEALVRAGVTPGFSSTTWGDPAYCQLSATVADEIREGASNGDEIGVFNRELHTQREANLRLAFEEYLRVGLSAGVFTST